MAEGNDEVLCDCNLPAVSRVVNTPGLHRGRTYKSCIKETGDPSRCGFFMYDHAPPPLEDNKQDENMTCVCNIKCSYYQIKKASPNQGKFFWSCGLPIGHPERCDFYQVVGGPKFTPLEQAPAGYLCICGERAVVGTSKMQGGRAGIARKFYRCKTKTCAFLLWT